MSGGRRAHTFNGAWARFNSGCAFGTARASRTGVSDVADERSPGRESGPRAPNGTSASAEKPAEKPDDRPAERGPGPLTVERITHQDVPAVCSLYKKVWEAEPTGLPAPLIKTWQPTPLEFTSWMEGVTYFAGRRNGRLVGTVGCELREGSCRLVHLAVDPEVRRQGVASALLAAAIDWARHANAPEIWIDALARFTAAAELFKHLGFSECGRLHRHQWNEDVLLFERLLA